MAVGGQEGSFLQPYQIFSFPWTLVDLNDLL